MSDSFADLWSSSTAIPPKTKPQTLASASSSSNNTTRGFSKPDVFSLLATSTQPRSTEVDCQDSAWLGLDSLVRSSTGTTPSGVTANLIEGDDWGLTDFSSAASTVNNFDSSGLDFDITIQDADGPRDQGRVGTGTRLLDLDNDAASFGLLDQDPGTSRGDDDILGILSQPVEVVKAQTRMQNLSPSPNLSRQSSFDDQNPSNKRSKPPSASSSPPPHILGQIVEMGFSVEQAKNALANTRDGTDVQAALETLLGSSGVGLGEDSVNERVVVEEAQVFPPVRRGPPKGFRERERERTERMRQERERGPSVPTAGSDVVSDMQEHADRLLSQASEIGFSVLSKASAFWKEKTERVVKVYEETAPTTITGQKERVDGGPKWMQVKEGVAGSFRDEDGDDDGLKAKGRRIPRITQESEQRSRGQDKHTELESEVDLFGTGPLKPAQPRRTPSSSQVSVTESATPLPTRERPLPTASPSTLSAVDKHKTMGSSRFKLGQYASAIESYSAAINCLPDGHLLLLPLFNNRALARMRTGEYKAAADDTAQALGIVLVNEKRACPSDEFDPNAKESAMQITISSWHPSMEPSSILLAAAQQKDNGGGWTHPQGIGVDLTGGYVKALRRRAESSEGRERWSEALKFWEMLSAGDSALIKEHLRKDAQRSAARCRRMIADESNKGDKVPNIRSSTAVRKPRPTAVVSTAPSAALRSLQASSAQAEAEDNLKHQLKDSVDSKVVAWRTGKETNIRALLASLDMVLWEEVSWVGGLHELVTPAQVKKGYMKAIARVHPDKLKAQDSTVEQRMLANAVFGTLSEAWTSFQNSNG